MADESVIKSFLVDLGFKVDEQSQKKFVDGIEGATKSVAKLVTVITGASLTIAAGVSAFASNLENLYFASQRIGASAEGIRASERASQDLGASAEEARAALEGVARFMRENPGGESLIKGLGVQTRDANGKLLETQDILVGLSKQFQGTDYVLARQLATQLGIGENQLLAMLEPDYAKRVQDEQERIRRSGLDKATKDAHDFMLDMRDIGREFTDLSTRIQAELMRLFGPQLERFKIWLEANGPMIATRVGEIADSFVKMGEEAGPHLKTVWDFFVGLDKATDGWSTKIIAALAVLKLIGALSLVTAIASLATAFFNLGKAITAASGAALGAGALSALVAGLVAILYSPSLNEGEDEIVKKIREKQGLPPVEQQTSEQAANERAIVDGWKKGMKLAKEVDQDEASQLMDFFESMGWTKEQSAGIVANLAAESNFDPKAKGDNDKALGIAQWHPERQANFHKWAGYPMTDPRADTMKQAEFVDFELTQGTYKRVGALLRATTNAESAGRVVSQHYEIPKNEQFEMAKRGTLATQLVQNTTINVNGTGDPGAVGQSVANEQVRVGEQVTRNMNTVMVN